MSTLRIHVTVFYCPSVVAETCSHDFLVCVFPGFLADHFLWVLLDRDPVPDFGRSFFFDLHLPIP
jgi:hypothetical protein